MPRYKITPNPERLDDSGWKYSSFQGTVIVEADNEQAARQKVADVFDLPDNVTMGGTSANPIAWIDTDTGDIIPEGGDGDGDEEKS